MTASANININITLTLETESKPRIVYKAIRRKDGVIVEYPRYRPAGTPVNTTITKISDAVVQDIRTRFVQTNRQ